jgi:hypothetical protein
MTLSNLQDVQDHVIHHAANAAAITFPVMSVVLKAPYIFSFVTGFLGMVWYCILIGEKIAAWRQRRKDRRNVR